MPSLLLETMGNHLGGDPEADSEHSGGITCLVLAWGPLGTPQEELKDFRASFLFYFFTLLPLRPGPE